MRSAITTLSALLVLGVSGPVAAQQEKAAVATLDKLEGTVMVDKGNGYVTRQPNLPLAEGDRVITLGNSSAEIVFNDGCRATLKANNLMVISIDPGCKAAIVAVNPPAPVAAAAPAAIPAAGASALAISALAGVVVIPTIAFAGDDDDPISGE